MTCVVSIYRPCHGSNRASSVFTQYVRYFTGRKEQDKNPRAALYEDLFMEATRWKAEGDHLIIAGDANKDVRRGLTFKGFYCSWTTRSDAQMTSEDITPASNQ
jgi:hypothetical protein